MAEETWHRRHRGDRPQLPVGSTPVDHFEHIHSIIDSVFGPEDDGPVPTAHTMVEDLDLTICSSCGHELPPGATFHLCGPCHWIAIEEAV